MVLCKRTASERERESREGVTFWVHYLNGYAPAPHAPELVPTARRASPEILDLAYRTALDALDLAATERDGLLARGLSRAAIAAGGYRSLEIRGRARVARAIAEAVGEDEALTVPGVYVAEGERGRQYLSFAGAAGLVIPCRGTDGIHALKVRAREAGEGPRYTFVSSARRGGPGAVSALHVPLAARERLGAPGTTLVITEGPLKADVATHLSAHAVVAVPGVGQWQLALDLVRETKPEKVCVAFDMDRFDPDPKKLPIARATHALVDALRRVHPRVALWQWDPAHKGIDDHYLAQRASREAREAREAREGAA